MKILRAGIYIKNT